MKTKSYFPIALIFLFLLFAGVSTARAQTPPVVGGYVNADTADEAVIAATKFALRKQSRTQKKTLSLVSIKGAKMQVVAGMNYEICMQISAKTKLKQKPVTQFVKTIVYRSLKNVYSLTSWKVLKSAEECEE